MGAAPVLMITKDGEALKNVPIEGEAMLGRSDGCVIRLDDRAVSRQHALFRSIPGGVQVERKSEFAPLIVNGSECTKAVLKEGDVIAIGPYLVKLALQQEAPSIQLATSLELPPQQHQLAPSSSGLSLEPPPGDPPAETMAPLEFSTVEQQPAAEPSAPSEDTGSLELALEGTGVTLSKGVVTGPVDSDALTKASSREMSVQLLFPPGIANVTEYAVEKDEISIGRGKDCDIILDDKRSSRKHAVVMRTERGFTIKDLASANGTYVNGAKIDEYELAGEENIRIGGAEFQFKVLNLDYIAKQNSFGEVPKTDSGVVQNDYKPIETPAHKTSLSIAVPTPSPTFAPPPSPLTINETGTININGLAGIPGIVGTAGPQNTASLLEKFRAQPKFRQYLIIAVVILGGMQLFDEDKPAKTTKVAKSSQKTQVDTASPGSTAKVGPTFDSLNPAQKKNVETWHGLAFDHYKNQDYDRTIFELNKIFQLVGDYKDSRELERYAKEGKRKLEALEEERVKRAQEAKIREETGKLLQEAQLRMKNKEYDQAKELFSQILTLDPDNADVAKWKAEVDASDDKKQLDEQARDVRREILKSAWQMLASAERRQSKENFRGAIADYKKAIQMGSGSRKLLTKAKSGLEECRQAIESKRDPVLAEAKTAEDGSELVKAYQLYQKATVIDPSHPAGYAGMDRIRSVLHDKAKGYYTEAILAESYSDFATAKKKFQDCMETAPKDDIYYDRAQRKLARFFGKGDLTP